MNYLLFDFGAIYLAIAESALARLVRPDDPQVAELRTLSLTAFLGCDQPIKYAALIKPLESKTALLLPEIAREESIESWSALPFAAVSRNAAVLLDVTRAAAFVAGGAAVLLDVERAARAAK